MLFFTFSCSSFKQRYINYEVTNAKADTFSTDVSHTNQAALALIGKASFTSAGKVLNDASKLHLYKYLDISLESFSLSVYSYLTWCTHDNIRSD